MNIFLQRLCPVGALPLPGTLGDGSRSGDRESGKGSFGTSPMSENFKSLSDIPVVAARTPGGSPFVPPLHAQYYQATYPFSWRIYNQVFLLIRF